MNRRNFFRSFGGLIAAVAVSQKVVLDLVNKVSFKNLPLLEELTAEEKYRLLPYYMVKQEMGRFHSKNWVALFDKVQWEPNMGNTLRSVKE